MGKTNSQKAPAAVKRGGRKMGKIIKGAALVAAAYGAKKVYDLARTKRDKETKETSSTKKR